MSNKENYLIKDELEVFNLLKSIQKSRQLISISFKSLPQYCLTLLLDIHKAAGILVFDESNPKITAKLIENKNEAEFSLKLEQLPVIFNSKLIANNDRPNVLYAHFPKEIYYPQNRRNYRYRTEFMDNIQTTIFLPAQKKLDCVLVNISIGGLCLRFPHSATNKFHLNHLIDDIHIKLPNSKGFSVSAKVQFKHYDYNNANIALGLQINHENASTEKAIQQFIYHS